MRPRDLVPLFLVAVAAVSVWVATLPHSSTARATWIGLAATLSTAGLVDGSARLDSRTRERAVQRLVGERVARINQDVVWMVKELFCLSDGDSRHRLEQLDNLTSPVINLNEEANVWPKGQPKLGLVVAARERIKHNLETAVDLAAVTDDASRIGEFEGVLQSNGIMILVRYAEAEPVHRGATLPVEAVKLLTVVQRQFDWYARRGGPGWRWGDASSPRERNVVIRALTHSPNESTIHWFREERRKRREHSV
jgi:hypothetical protein